MLLPLFHLLFYALSRGRAAICHIVDWCVCARVGFLSFFREFAHVQETEQAQPPLKIPLREICIGLLCYSRLSGTLAGTYLSMSVLKKQKNLIGFLPPSILSFLFLSLFSRFASLLLGINLHPFPPSPLSVHLHAKHSPQNCPSSRPWLLIVWLYIGFRPQPHGICNTHVVCAISAFPIFFQAHNSLLFSGVGMQVLTIKKGHLIKLWLLFSVPLPMIYTGEIKKPATLYLPEKLHLLRIN